MKEYRTSVHQYYKHNVKNVSIYKITTINTTVCIPWPVHYYDFLGYNSSVCHFV
jgi:hypothetical protein